MMESAKSLPKLAATREAEEPCAAANPLQTPDIKMIGTRGFEPRTPTVSR
jgi:hypothetical protein